LDRRSGKKRKGQKGMRPLEPTYGGGKSKGT